MVTVRFLYLPFLHCTGADLAFFRRPKASVSAEIVFDHGEPCTTWRSQQRLPARASTTVQRHDLAVINT